MPFENEAQRRADEIREQRREAGTLGKPIAERDWCPECQTSQDVEDRFVEDTGDSRVVVEVYSVTALACGHQVTRQTDRYPSPLQQAKLPRAYELGRLSDGYGG